MRKVCNPVAGLGSAAGLLQARPSPSPCSAPMPCQVVAGPGGIVLRDGSTLTPDSQVVSANTMVS